MAAQKNFEVDQNATFTFEVEYLDEDLAAIQLNFHTAKLQVRDTQGGKKLAFTLTETDGIVISPTLGKLQISISADRTNKMFYPKSAYDLVLIDPSVNKTRLLEGYMTLNRSVTI
ncbi:MAG: hypothetical protein D4R39_05120 [Methylophilaceae bacterium]|nr:MAG: hypothetical protein D4R39_05120 [Methylophilaceae bacterium]